MRREAEQGTVSYWCRGIHRPSGNVRYGVRVGPDLGWVLGAIVGDGSKRFRCGKKNYHVIEIRGRPEIVEIFAETVPKIIGRGPLPIYPAERGLVRASFRCARLYHLLSDFDALVELIESDKEVKRGFLQGFADAEASISGQELCIYNTDLELLHLARKWLSEFGVESTGPHLSVKRGEHGATKDCFYIRVRASHLEAFREKIGFRVERKRKKLEEAVEKRRKQE